MEVAGLKISAVQPAAEAGRRGGAGAARARGCGGGGCGGGGGGMLAAAPQLLVLVLLVLGTGGRGEAGCAGRGGARLECRAAGLTALPALTPGLHALDVSENNISSLPAELLLPAADLRDLNLSANELSSISASALRGGLQRLWLAACGLDQVPHMDLPELHYLSLAGNVLDELRDDSLPSLPALHTLILKRNRISYISERAFASTPALRVLRLEENQLAEVPAALQLLPLLEDLWLSHNRVWSVPAQALQGSRRLQRVDLSHNPLTRLHRHALDHLPDLTTLVLSSCRGVRALPALNGTLRLRTLRADRAALTSAALAAPPALCRRAPRLRALDLKSNQLDRVPDLHDCAELRVLELSSNQITTVEGRPLRGLSRLHDLLMARNLLSTLPRDLFRDTPHLQLIDLEDNQIEHIDLETFLPINKLLDLNVGNNVFAHLPAGGLQHLRHLKAHNNPHLKHFHPPQIFPQIQTLVLSYAYHCCEFLPEAEGGAAGAAGEAGEGGARWPAADGEGDGDGEGEGLTDLVLVAPRRVDLAAWANATDVYAHYLNATGENLGGWGWSRGRVDRRGGGGGVQCLPMPGPFLPCVDLFDWWTLRCGVWAVFLLALLGNGTVVIVLACSRGRLDVPRFLVANLAAADLCMGLYLGILAVVDAGTLGQFRAHALAWQMSGGCRLAGFLGVLSAELSVYTLAVITLERNYAITHAMHLNKRLSLRHAAAVMAAGWGFALAAAALPLLGVSDYRKFAVCLPFETSGPAALGYVLALLAINGAAFLVLLGCYLKMYCAIRGSQAWNSNDSRIAKRMALLVFTDFLCWAPVALCALSAALGLPLVSLEEAKVLTVFVLPLNSCCNPFLYAILTKQFKKDCTLVCKAIEESRVTRGIGRCRHSSNFSNRQTPANTNSLAERSSRGGGGGGGAAGHAPACACRRLLAEEAAVAAVLAPPAPRRAAPQRPAPARLLRWLRSVGRRQRGREEVRGPLAARGGAAPARAGSVSSSVEFSSSRSDSWRAGRPPPPPRRAASWLVARKTSQDSNLSSSRNDSSGSNATASTGTWRTSRSAGSAATVSAGPAGPVGPASAPTGPRPRLTRQPAVLGEEPPPSPPELPPALAPAPRTLPTIPSAAEPEPPLDDDSLQMSVSQD